MLIIAAVIVFILAISVFIYIRISIYKIKKIDIWKAITNGELKKVKAVLKYNPQLIQSTKKTGGTLLHISIYAGNSEMIDYLISQGIDINAISRHKWDCFAYCGLFM